MAQGRLADTGSNRRPLEYLPAGGSTEGQGRAPVGWRQPAPGAAAPLVHSCLPGRAPQASWSRDSANAAHASFVSVHNDNRAEHAALDRAPINRAVLPTPGQPKTLTRTTSLSSCLSAQLCSGNTVYYVVYTCLCDDSCSRLGSSCCCTPTILAGPTSVLGQPQQSALIVTRSISGRQRQSARLKAVLVS